MFFFNFVIKVSVFFSFLGSPKQGYYVLMTDMIHGQQKILKPQSFFVFGLVFTNNNLRRRRVCVFLGLCLGSIR